MKQKIVTAFVIMIGFCTYADPQEKCPDDKQIIMSFLKTVSDPHYKSTLRDFINFFDSKANEIEGGLRHEYFINNHGAVLSWDDPNSRSLAIDQFLNDTTIKRLLIIKRKKNFNWAILSSFKVGLTSIIYMVGLEQTAGSFQIQFVKWPESSQYGIREILDSTGESIYSSIYYKK